MLVLNAPICPGNSQTGLPFGFRSLYGTISLSLAIDLLAPVLPVPTQDVLLASLYGESCGPGPGAGFPVQGTTGGTDLAAAVLRTYTGANIGRLLFLVDGAVVLAAWVTFDSAELAMYALLTIFIVSWLIDVVQEGISYAKAFLIISRRPSDIAEAIVEGLNRGATAWSARGVYTGTDREVVLSVVNRSEVSRLKEIIYQVDPGAL